MNIEQFTALLDRHPVVVTENLPALGLIPGLDVVTDLMQFQRQLETGKLNADRRYAILHGNAALRRRFIVTSPTFDPFGPGLSDALFTRFPVFHDLMLTQDQVAHQVIAHSDNDVIIMVVVDGLSFRDCRSLAGVKPCLVPGVTKTREGYRRTIGQPTIGRRLERLGFVDLVGFSYWDRDGDATITNEIFVPFAPSQMHKVREFKDILEVLDTHKLRKTYVQIVLQGLDYMSHGISDEPLIEEHVQRLFKRLDMLADILRRRKRKATVFMTADHGILWRTQHSLQKMTEASWTSGDGVRYLHGKLLRPYLRHDAFDGAHYSLMRYPFILRNLGPTEWGVHGGVSYEESIVPFYMQEV